MNQTPARPAILKRRADLGAHVRIIPFEGVENFRDMGGHQATDGRTVRYGQLYRSSALYYLTEKDRELFSSLSIQYILDYRSPFESQSEPNPVFDGVWQEQVPASETDDPFDDDYLSEAFRSRLTAEGLTGYYRMLALGNPSYRRLLEVALRPDITRIVHHCAAGKDRTGVGAAILLMALGVPRETVMEDYMLSAKLLPRYMERSISPVREHYSPQELAYFSDAFTVKEAYLQTFFDVVDSTYASTSDFLEHEFGLTPALRRQLQDKFLE